ncbi:MAG: aspartyl protease family protein [bacterium]
MGKVIEKVKLSNIFDGKKSIKVDAVIDTGATLMTLPQNLVYELGLKKIREATVRYANNKREKKYVYGAIALEIKGRKGIFEVLAEAEGSQPLVGQVVLEALDFIVDPKTKTLMPNPLSPDMPMVELLSLRSLKEK